MNNGICLNAMIPFRAAPSHKSEMTDQLLFGEIFSILEDHNDWHFIRRWPDGYEGWIQEVQPNRISEEQVDQIKRSGSHTVCEPFTSLSMGDSEIRIPGGSILPLYDSSARGFELNGRTYRLRGKTPAVPSNPRERIDHMARLYLNAPYLWGGKTPFGIDCSGFIQVVFRACGIQLPRDSHQQLKEGSSLGFVKDAQPADLAFFDNDQGEIIHAGIMLGPDQIIHASGRVKINPIDHQGIYNRELKKYTHKLRVVRKIID